MSEFDDTELGRLLGRYAGGAPDSGAAYTGLQRRITRARRKRAAAWAVGGVATMALGTAALAAPRGQDTDVIVGDIGATTTEAPLPSTTTLVIETSTTVSTTATTVSPATTLDPSIRDVTTNVATSVDPTAGTATDTGTGGGTGGTTPSATAPATTVRPTVTQPGATTPTTNPGRPQPTTTDDRDDSDSTDDSDDSDDSDERDSSGSGNGRDDSTDNTVDD